MGDCTVRGNCLVNASGEVVGAVDSIPLNIGRFRAAPKVTPLSPERAAEIRARVSR